MISYTAPIPDTVTLAELRGRKTHFRLFDSMSECADFAETQASRYHGNSTLSGPVRDNADFYGSMTLEEAIGAFRHGDLSGVASSDALLAQAEKHTIDSPRKAWRNDVAGAMPDVQAFIAGHPLSMRRRFKTVDDSAPLAIVVDTGAQSTVKIDAIRARGAAILALVRTLAARRPIELWAGSILEAWSGNASATFYRIDTTPLDLARAAFALTSPAAIKRVVWACAMAHGFQARKPYGLPFEDVAEQAARIVTPAFPQASDVLFIQRNLPTDAAPMTWLAAQVAKYAPDLAA